jgi:hypothetical protein
MEEIGNCYTVFTVQASRTVGALGEGGSSALGSDVPQGEGMLFLCQGDFEEWVVVGPGPAPGIWVSMETVPRVTTNTGWNFSICSQAVEEWESSGKVLFFPFFFKPGGVGAAQGKRLSAQHSPFSTPTESQEARLFRSPYFHFIFPFVYSLSLSIRDTLRV